MSEEQGGSDPLRWANLRDEIVHCVRCPRLVKYRQKVAREKKRQFINWRYWGAPLPGFGDARAEVVIIGLAPAAHGGNRTGRMFTGDGSANFLMRALYAAGFANQPTSEHDHDGLRMIHAFMTAVVRCPPPQNKPCAREMANCSSYLDRELELLSHVRVVLTLGQVAFKGYLEHVRRRTGYAPRCDFKHAQAYPMRRGLPILVASYHPSRQNTQTGRLTSKMMDAALSIVKKALAEESS